MMSRLSGVVKRHPLIPFPPGSLPPRPPVCEDGARQSKLRVG
jgi:hypothetical protein